MTAQIALLPDGRLHLQHGPIDCLCRAWGTAAEVRAAYAQVADVFPAVLPGLCSELDLLRTPLPGAAPLGGVAAAMHAACAPYADRCITPMAAVAGAVADFLLAAMANGRTLDRAYVNDGGDIALHLSPGHAIRCGLVADLMAPSLDGTIPLDWRQPARGIATSGRACKGQGGRSFSFGIADAVTVLARTAAEADAAATVIANDVDLPDHPAVTRRPARDIDPDSDLGTRRVTWTVGDLTAPEIAAALAAGRRTAEALCAGGAVIGAILTLRGRFHVVGIDRPLLEAS